MYNYLPFCNIPYEKFCNFYHWTLFSFTLCLKLNWLYEWKSCLCRTKFVIRRMRKYPAFWMSIDKGKIFETLNKFDCFRTSDGFPICFICLIQHRTAELIINLIIRLKIVEQIVKFQCVLLGIKKGKSSIFVPIMWYLLVQKVQSSQQRMSNVKWILRHIFNF